ncbi:Alpha/Beta hydrolase protein [Mycena leptocephala]|nr:Alpha/Beta hydrolase protein [Mycena leptocephala]
MYDWVAQHPGGIIAVSITYRLTLLGFLGGPVVAAEGDLNAGLLDQRSGLEWIQRHISKFGGDPGNVTIYGEGAGGASVVMQVVAYGGTKPVPFKRATRQSIGFGPTNTAEQTDAFFSCPASGTDAMPCLRNASLVIEGPNGFLPDLPSRLITAGKINNAEFVGGHCTGDGKSFAGGPPDTFQTDDDVRQRVFSRWPGVSDTTIDRALAIYPEPNAPRKSIGDSVRPRINHGWGDHLHLHVRYGIFFCVFWIVGNSSVQGLVPRPRLTENGVKNVFSFSWNAPDTVLYNQTPYRGAAHTSDIYYLFEGTKQVRKCGEHLHPTPVLLVKLKLCLCVRSRVGVFVLIHVLILVLFDVQLQSSSSAFFPGFLSTEPWSKLEKLSINWEELRAWRRSFFIWLAETAAESRVERRKNASGNQEVSKNQDIQNKAIKGDVVKKRTRRVYHREGKRPVRKEVGSHGGRQKGIAMMEITAMLPIHAEN